MDHSEVKHLPKVDHTPAELDAPARLLLKAAALIDERGLAKGFLCDGVKVCFRGALNLAANGSPYNWGCAWDRGSAHWEAERRVTTALGLNPHSKDSDDLLSIPRWNNAPERTAEDVAGVMRRVALGG